MTLKIKKRKKNLRMRGKGMGTHGGGARKKRKKSGHKGGVGMAGSGKRADQKKTLITKLYGGNYFGKQGITSKKTERDKRKRIKLSDIEMNLGRYIEKGIAKKTPKGFEINLKDYKILGGFKKFKNHYKEKMIITAKEASNSVIEDLKKSGGEIILIKNKEKQNPKKEEIKPNKSEKLNKV